LPHKPCNGYIIPPQKVSDNDIEKPGADDMTPKSLTEHVHGCHDLES
jgi:hypothetical protein